MFSASKTWLGGVHDRWQEGPPSLFFEIKRLPLSAESTFFRMLFPPQSPSLFKLLTKFDPDSLLKISKSRGMALFIHIKWCSLPSPHRDSLFSAESPCRLASSRTSTTLVPRRSRALPRLPFSLSIYLSPKAVLSHDHRNPPPLSLQVHEDA